MCQGFRKSTWSHILHCESDAFKLSYWNTTLRRKKICSLSFSLSPDTNTWFKVQSIRLRKSLQRSMGSHLSAFILNQLSSCLFFLFSIEFVLLISPGLLFLISFSCLKICFITRYLSLSSWISSPQITLFWFVRVLSFSLLPRLLCSFFTRSNVLLSTSLAFYPPFHSQG